jgi:hypothetical protein
MRVRTSKVSIELRADGIVRATIDRGAELDLEDAKRAMAAIWEVAGRRRLPSLVEMSGLKSATRDARDYFGSAESAALCTAVALMVSSPVSRMIANFYLRGSPQKVPTRLFTDELLAIEWLRGLL